MRHWSLACKAGSDNGVRLVQASGLYGMIGYIPYSLFLSTIGTEDIGLKSSSNLGWLVLSREAVEEC